MMYATNSPQNIVNILLATHVQCAHVVVPVAHASSDEFLRIAKHAGFSCCAADCDRAVRVCARGKTLLTCTEIPDLSTGVIIVCMPNAPNIGSKHERRSLRDTMPQHALVLLLE